MNWLQKTSGDEWKPTQIFKKIVQAFDLHPIAENHPKGKFKPYDIIRGRIISLHTGTYYAGVELGTYRFCRQKHECNLKNDKRNYTG